MYPLINTLLYITSCICPPSILSLLILQLIIIITVLSPVIVETGNMYLQEFLSLDDDMHLKGLLSFEDPLFPIIPPMEFDYYLEYPRTLSTQSNFENFDDFHLWGECPKLSDEEALKPLRQLPPDLPCMVDNDSKLITLENAQSLFTDSIFSDQTLDTVVAEGLTMPRNGNKLEDEKIFPSEDIYNEIEGFMRLGNMSKVSKIESISYEEIRKYFDKPISRAAKELNVGLTVLKKRCRELNIKRWPHRKIKSLEALICNVKAQDNEGMIKMVELLEEHKRKLHFMPGLELTKETKKLRQQCFKANYKKRKALALTHV